MSFILSSAPTDFSAVSHKKTKVNDIFKFSGTKMEDA